MIQVSNPQAQTLTAGQSLIFTLPVSWTGNGECFRLGSSAVRLRGGIYQVTFNANVGGSVAATEVQLSISVDGSPIQTTTMKSVPAALGDLNNVSAQTYVRTCSLGASSITVTNTGTSTIIVDANPLLTVRRVAG